MTQPLLALTQLPGLIAAPTFDASVVEQSTGELFAHTDLSGMATGTQSNRGQVVAHMLRGCPSELSLSAAQLTAVVGAPAFDTIVIQKSAGRLSTCLDGASSAALTQVNRPGGVEAHTRCIHALAQLTRPVLSPTDDLSGFRQTTAEVSARCDMSKGVQWPGKWGGVGRRFVWFVTYIGVVSRALRRKVAY